MELIIKPTGVCNFACNFCMTNKLSQSIKHLEHVPNELRKQIDILKPDAIIINGGDPLLVGKDFYYELLDSSDCIIDIITNLKDFYNRPDYWLPLFKHERITVTTSFQYGSGRKWDIDTIYDEDRFLEVMNMFNEKIGYMPMFISVITSENDNKALDHLRLAKRLNTICKINPCLPLGIATEAYPKWKMVDIWLEAEKLGLSDVMNADIQFYNGGCSFNTKLLCASTIRVWWMDVNDKVHYSSCDNCSTLGDSIELDTVRPTLKQMKLDPQQFINKEKCLQCKLCRFCNACKANREAAKLHPTYCCEMKKRIDKIIEAKWFI